MTHRRRLGMIVVLGALTAFGPMSIDMYLPAFPLLASHFHADPSQVQLTLTACLVGLGAGQLLAGPLSDAMGRRVPLLVGLFTYATASVLCAFAPSVYVLAGLRLAQGLGGAAGVVIARAVVRDLYQGVSVARIFSLLMLINGMAPMLAPLAGGQLLRVTTWSGIFLVLAGYGAVLIAAVVLWLPETLRGRHRGRRGIAATARAFGSLATERMFLGYALAGGLAFTAMFAYISASSFVIQDIYHVSAQIFGLIFGTNALGLIIAGQINARLVVRYGPRRMLLVTLLANLAGGLGVLLEVLSGGRVLILLLVPLFVMVASNGFVLPNTTALALSEKARSAGTASALLGMVQFALGALVAPLVGLGGAHTALPMAIVMAAASVAANLALRTLTRSAEDLRSTRISGPPTGGGPRVDAPPRPPAIPVPIPDPANELPEWARPRPKPGGPGDYATGPVVA